jgi:hypothetical protein
MQPPLAPSPHFSRSLSPQRAAWPAPLREFTVPATFDDRRYVARPFTARPPSTAMRNVRQTSRTNWSRFGSAIHTTSDFKTERRALFFHRWSGQARIDPDL